MLKSFKYRLYPNKEQAVLLEKHFGCARFVYNWGLERKIEAYKKNKTSLSCFDLIKELTDYKKQEEFEWLNTVYSQALQASLRNLDNAYTRFFREKKGFPKFKSKHSSKKSYQLPQGAKVDFEGGKIFIPKLKWTNVEFSRKFKGTIKTTTVSKTPTGKFYVSILVEDEKEAPKKKKLNRNKAIGLDLGIKSFAVTSDGEVIENPKTLKRSLGRLKVLQRRASKKTKGSNNRRKSNFKVALLHEKITNKRNDFLHKLSTKLVRENQTICLENLNVQGMVKNHRLAQAIQDCSWSRFVSMLEYKAEWSGVNILKIGTFEPSSKMCHVCGHINKELTLKDREWTCSSCQSVLDRDTNASKNILDFAFHKQNKLYRAGQARWACGAVNVS
jgi:putative transposase